MNSQSGIRAGLILLILLLAAVLVILLVNLMPLMATAGSLQSPAPRVRRGVTSQVTLAEAEPQARARAQEWRGDAVLVRAEAAWYIAPGWEKVESPPVAWAFYYYSAAEKAVASVVIDDDAVLWVPPFEIPTPPRAIDNFPPQYGLDVAWISFRGGGGDEFLRQHPEAQVTFRLQPKDGRPLWGVSAFDEGDYLAIELDAQSGTVLLDDRG